MTLPGLTIIGERINPGFASSRALLEKQDIKGLQELAVSQEQKGASYLTINVGDHATQNPDFLRDLIVALQEVVNIPLAFDYPALSVQEVCLKVYDPAKANGQKPIVNSISELRWDMFEALKIQPAKVVLMASERMENGVAVANQTAQEVTDTAERLVSKTLAEYDTLTPDDLFIDVSLCPLASDTEGGIRNAVDAIDLIGKSQTLRGTHTLVGLSNMGIMLPNVMVDGMKLSMKVESAFLTMTLPHGLDTILGTAGRDYQMLSEDDHVYKLVKEIIRMDGYDALERVPELYASR